MKADQLTKYTSAVRQSAGCLLWPFMALDCLSCFGLLPTCYASAIPSSSCLGQRDRKGEWRQGGFPVLASCQPVTPPPFPPAAVWTRETERESGDRGAFLFWPPANLLRLCHSLQQLSGPQRQIGRAETGGLGSVLSAGEYTTTLVVRLTEDTSLLMCPSNMTF